jgi:hypothetical protein
MSVQARNACSILLAILGVLFLISCNLVALSHVQGNVPPGEDFDAFLKRDLEGHFRELSGRNVSVDWELLREGPTQSGMSYPKFYAWVTVYDQDIVIDEGAVAVAAVDKERFDVITFLSRDTIASDPEMIYNVFPGIVCERIEERLD